MLKFLSLSAAALLLIAGPALAAPDDTAATPEKPARPRAPFRAASCATTPTRTASSTAPNGRPRQEARFKQLDANGDGKLTQDELFARTPAIGNSVLPTDRQAQRQSTYFQLLDADKDGVVTLGRVHGPGRPQLRALRHQQGRPHRHRRMPPGAAAQVDAALRFSSSSPVIRGRPGGGRPHRRSCKTMI